MATRKFEHVIRDRRRQLGLTQEHLARKINSSASYISNLEAGKRTPSRQLTAKLADALDLDSHDLLLLTIPKITSFLSDTKNSQDGSAWDSFLKDDALRTSYEITEDELSMLSKVAMMGEVRSSHDFIFVLKSIRQASRRWLR